MTDYAFADLLRAQARTHAGREVLQAAIEQCDRLLAVEDIVDMRIFLRIHQRQLSRALSLLRDIQPQQTAS